MKTIYIYLILLLISWNTYAQVPHYMSYQAVVRNADGALITNQTVGVQISIVKGDISGTVVYSEIHLPSTNSSGLLTLAVGNGTQLQGTFSEIDWGTDIYFIKTDIDPEGGNNYSISSSSQMMSVPYALYAEKAGSSSNGTDGKDGIDGKDGVGIESTVYDGDGRFTFNFTDGTWFTTPSLQGDAGLSAYDLAVKLGFQGTESEWLASLKGKDGTQGQNGINGLSAYELAVTGGFQGTEQDWLSTLKGEKGDTGEDGSSAYDIAVNNGFQGTEDDWVNSLKEAEDGEDGKSAYDIAIENGYSGTESEWLLSLKGNTGNDGNDGTNGTDGEDGKSAYQVAYDLDNTIGDEATWLASLKGEKGEDGEDGEDGTSAYDIAVSNGFVGDQNSWLTSLKGDTGTQGEQGISAYQVAINNGFEGTEEEWVTSLKEAQDGKSAYDIAVENGYSGTESEWLLSLKGDMGAQGNSGLDGTNGTDGKSAYQIAFDLDNSIGTEADWIASLNGTDGQDGTNGTDGQDGTNGTDGKSAYQIAFDLDNSIGTEADWIASLNGADGQDGTNGTDGQDGTNGTDGKSAYQIAFDLDNSIGTEADWIASLYGTDGQDGTNGTDGQDGTNGTDGKSAYQIAFDLDNSIGTEADWIASLYGTDGQDGTNGTNGDSAYDIWLNNGNEGTESDFLQSLEATDTNLSESEVDSYVSNNGYIVNPGSENANHVLSTDGSGNFSWITPTLSNLSLDAGNQVIENVLTPTTNLQAANKYYVDYTAANSIDYDNLLNKPTLITQILGGNGMTGDITSGSGTLNVVADNGLTTLANRIQLGGPLTAGTTITAGAYNFNLNLNNTGNFNILDGTTTRFLVRNDGNVAIKHNNPTQALDINGQVRIRGGSPGANKVLTSDVNGVATWVLPITQVAGGNGMTGNITSGNGTLNVVAESGLKTNADNIRLGGSLKEVTNLDTKDNNLNIRLKDGTGGGGNFNIQSEGGTSYISVLANGETRFRGTSPVTGGVLFSLDDNGTTKWSNELYINNSNGSVGVRTNTPEETLDVDGRIRMRGESPQRGMVLFAGNDEGSFSWSDDLYLKGADIGFGTNNPDGSGNRNFHIHSNSGGDVWTTYSTNGKKLLVGMTNGGAAQIRTHKEGTVVLETSDNSGKLKVSGGRVRVEQGNSGVEDDGLLINRDDSGGDRNWVFYIDGEGNLQMRTQKDGSSLSKILEFRTGDVEGEEKGMRIDGRLIADGAVIDGNNVSDRRLKENIDTLKTALDEIMQLGVYSYNYIKDADSVRHYGFMAQEVMQYFPENVIVVDKEGHYALLYDQMVPVLTKAVQEQQVMIEELQKKNEKLEISNNAYEERIKNLEAKAEASALQNEKVNDLFLKLEARIQELENANASLEQK